MSDSVTPWNGVKQASLSFTISWNLLKFMSIESISSFAISSFASLFYFCLQSFPVSELALHINWPKHRSFDFSTSPSNEYSGLTSFRIDSLTLPSVQGTLKSLLQHHISKASILWCLAFFTVQLSYPYMTIGETIALTMWTLVSKVMSLVFHTLPRFVIAFILRSKHLLISWLLSPSTSVLEPKKLKCVILYTFSVCHKVIGLDAMILVF